MTLSLTITRLRLSFPRPSPFDIRLLLIVQEKAFDARQSGAHSLLIVEVIVPEKVDQSMLFLENTLAEKTPTNDRVREKTERILQQNLSANAP